MLNPDLVIFSLKLLPLPLRIISKGDFLDSRKLEYGFQWKLPDAEFTKIRLVLFHIRSLKNTVATRSNEIEREFAISIYAPTIITSASVLFSHLCLATLLLLLTNEIYCLFITRKFRLHVFISNWARWFYFFSHLYVTLQDHKDKATHLEFKLTFKISIP